MKNIGNIKEQIDFTKKLIEELMETRPDLKKELQAKLDYLEAIPKFFDAGQDLIVDLCKDIPAVDGSSTYEADGLKIAGLESLLQKTVEHWCFEIDMLDLKLNPLIGTRPTASYYGSDGGI